MNKTYAILLAPLFLFFPACGEKAEEVQEESAIQEIVLSLCPYDGDVDTKTSYDYDSKYFLWAEGDAVGIVSPLGGQLKFAIESKDYGQQHADFDGRGFALVAGTSYASYCPFIPDYDLNPNAIPVHYDGQVQTGDNSYAHLGAYSYTVAMGTSPVGSQLNFVYRNVGSPHRYAIPVPTGEYSNMTLVLPSNKYIIEGTLNLMAATENEQKTISPTVVSNQLSLGLTSTTIASAGDIQCWAMVPPANLVGDVIHVRLQRSDGSECLAAIAGRDGPANTRRFYYAACSVYPAISVVNSEGGSIQITVVKRDAGLEMDVAPDNEWITAAGSSSDGVVTTYTFNVAENTGAERIGTIVFTETVSGLANTVTVRQSRAGAIIGIGSTQRCPDAAGCNQSRILCGAGPRTGVLRDTRPSGI